MGSEAHVIRAWGVKRHGTSKGCTFFFYVEVRALMCLEAHRLYVETFGSIGSSWVDRIALRRSDRSGSIGSFWIDRIVLRRSDRSGSIGSPWVDRFFWGHSC